MKPPRQGVYRHYKPGPDGKPRYYQLLWTAELVADVGAEDPLYVCAAWRVREGAWEFFIRPTAPSASLVLVKARAHTPMKAGTVCCVYVPLYADKPGLRVSVRPLLEWTERMGVEPASNANGGSTCDVMLFVSRFEWVGETIEE